MVDQFQWLNLRFENIFLLLILIIWLIHHSWSHHTTTHHRITSHHWITSHTSCWSSWFFSWLTFSFVIRIILFQKQTVDLSQTKHDKEIERCSWYITDVKIFETDSWLSHGFKFLGEWERNFCWQESWEEGVDPNNSRNCGSHHHKVSFHSIHHGALHAHHVVCHISGFSGTFFLEISLVGFAQEGSSGVESVRS